MNHRHFIRQLTPAFARDYCKQREVELPANLARARGAGVSGDVVQLIENSDTDAARAVLADVERCLPLVAEQGQEALSSALRDDAALVEFAATLANPEERAIWVLAHHPQRFERAEAFLFADYRTDGSWGRNYRLAAGLTVSADPSVHQTFADAVGAFFRRHDGSGRSCQAEIAPRDDQSSVQVTIFIEGKASSVVRPVSSGFARGTVWHTIEAAVVYNRAGGLLTIVAKGGRPVHDAVHEAFGRIMLGGAPGVALPKRGNYPLDTLVPPRPLAPLPATGVIAARVRRLRLRPRSGYGVLVVEAPAGRTGQSVYDLSGQWFPDGARFLEHFAVEGATITLHFDAEPGRRRAKAINVEMTRLGTSNVKRLPRVDRGVAEAHLAAWGLVPE